MELIKKLFNNIKVKYQPIVNLKDFYEKTNGEEKNKKDYDYKKFEALTYLNYNGEELNYFKTKELLENLDKENLNQNLRFLTEKVFNQVVSDIKKYHIEVSFNISVDDIKDKKLRNLFIDNLKFLKTQKSKKDKSLSELITFEFIEEQELSNISNIKDVEEFIEKIKSYKAKVSLDDFGKGYATFAPLIDFKFDVIKLDGILTKNFLNSPKKYYLIEMLLEMSSKLNIEVVSEFLEEKEELDALLFIECPYGQGYYFSAPKTLDFFLKKNNI